MSIRNVKLSFALAIIRKFLSRAENSIELTFLSLRKQILLRNWIAVLIANIAAWFFEEKYADPSFSTLTIRSVICMIGLPLVVAAHRGNRSGPIRFQKLYLLGFFILLLPFMFGLIGLLNAATSYGDQELSAIWIFEYMAALFLFYGLLSTEQQALLVCVLSHVTSLTIVLLIFPEGSRDALLFSIGMISAQMTIFGFATLTHRRLQFVNQQKIEAAYAIGSKVAHEIRTPLLTIKNLADSASKELNNIESAYNTPGAENLTQKKLRQISLESTYANTTIDMLLVTSSAAPFTYDPKEKMAAQDCVLNTIRRYPYANASERDRVKIGEAKDFRTTAPERLIQHVLLNLIRNAILSARPDVEPKIVVSYAPDWKAGSGEICVTDNGIGVPAEIEDRIFENFFSTRETGEGAGLGLAFCKSVMVEIGGDIEYSRRGDCTQFTLQFREREA